MEFSFQSVTNHPRGYPIHTLTLYRFPRHLFRCLLIRFSIFIGRSLFEKGENRGNSRVSIRVYRTHSISPPFSLSLFSEPAAHVEPSSAQKVTHKAIRQAEMSAGNATSWQLHMYSVHRCFGDRTTDIPRKLPPLTTKKSFR